MNRYKKELALQGYTSMPTVKNIISKKTGNVLKHIDNWDIKTLKTALGINKRKKLPVLQINFTIEYMNKKTKKIIITNNEVRRGTIGNRKDLLAYIKAFQKKNTSNNCKIFSNYDENEKPVYNDCRQLCLYSLKVL